MRSETRLTQGVPMESLVPAERRLIRNMASALCQALAIPEGQHLVPVLGLGGERSNREAMVSWVHCLAVGENLVPATDTLPVFLSWTERRLAEWRDAI